MYNNNYRRILKWVHALKYCLKNNTFSDLVTIKSLDPVLKILMLLLTFRGLTTIYIDLGIYQLFAKISHYVLDEDYKRILSFIYRPLASKLSNSNKNRQTRAKSSITPYNAL